MEPNKHATVSNEAHPQPWRERKTRWWYHPPSWISMQGLSWVLKAYIWARGPLATLCIRLPPITHTERGLPIPPVAMTFHRSAIFFFGSAGYLPYPITLQAAFNRPCTTRTLPFLLSFLITRSFFFSLSPLVVSLGPYLCSSPGGPLDTLCITDSPVPPVLTHSSCTHTHTHTHTHHTHTHTPLRLLQSFALLQTLSVFWLRCLGAGWERERKKIMCMCVWVCECDLYLRVAGFLIRGQGPHCSDKDRDGDRGLLEPLPKETLSYETDNVLLKSVCVFDRVIPVLLHLCYV